MEVELKLLLAPSCVPALRRHPAIKRHAAGKPRQRELVSVYFDTPDFYFRKHDAALRVRKTGRRWVQTFKAGGQVGAGLHQRNEWESPVFASVPQLARLSSLVGDDTAWQTVLTDPAIANAIKPVFTTQFRRTTWLLRMENETEIELALDQGVAQHGESQVPICEIELELKHGDATALFDFALQLLQDVPLRVSNISKSDRGYALLAPQPALPVKAVKFALSGGMSIEQVFETVVHNCLTQVQANETAVEQAIPEGVHQMRVGLRRLRSALRLFDDAFSFPEDLLSELRWLAGDLGAAREWHVFSEMLDAVISDYPQEQPLLQLRQLALNVEKQKEQAAAKAVSSLRYTRLMLAIGAWLYGRHWRKPSDGSGQAALPVSLEAFAARALTRSRKRLLKREKPILEGPPDERHRARIVAKRARYTAEFFQSLYSPKKIQRYIESLADVQELLGEYQDVATASMVLDQIMEIYPEMARTCGYVEGYFAARIRRWTHKVEKPWRKYASQRLPRASSDKR